MALCDRSAQSIAQKDLLVPPGHTLGAGCSGGMVPAPGEVDMSWFSRQIIPSPCDECFTGKINPSAELGPRVLQREVGSPWTTGRIGAGSVLIEDGKLNFKR